MAVKKRAAKANHGARPRTSVTFPHDLYQTIEEMAKKKVSIAWVVREAVEKYVADHWPLFNSRGGSAPNSPRYYRLCSGAQ